jgi:hypothetical protein
VTDWSVRLRNEFAGVDVSLDLDGNAPRLRIRDEHTGSEILLDPLELSALSTCVHADLAPFMEALRIPGSLATPQNNGSTPTVDLEPS